MKKIYIEPAAELISLKYLEDFLSLSPGDLEDDDEGEMGGSTGTVQPERPGIWG